MDLVKDPFHPHRVTQIFVGTKGDPQILEKPPESALGVPKIRVHLGIYEGPVRLQDKPASLWIITVAQRTCGACVGAFTVQTAGSPVCKFLLIVRAVGDRQGVESWTSIPEIRKGEDVLESFK
jgi:hypothetical protein